MLTTTPGYVEASGVCLCAASAPPRFITSNTVVCDLPCIPRYRNEMALPLTSKLKQLVCVTGTVIQHMQNLALPACTLEFAAFAVAAVASARPE